MVCVYSYKPSMSNVTPGVSIVSCLKFVRLNARFATVNARNDVHESSPKAFVRLNALLLCSISPKVHLLLQFIQDSVAGFLYLITERHLKSLDAYEGYPKVYRRMWLDVKFRGETYQTVTYEMTAETKLVRNGLSYPEECQKICSAGAKFRHVKNQFAKRRTKE